MSLPDGPDDITADWLTEALRGAVIPAGARVVACRGAALALEKGATSRIARLRLTYDDAAAGPPTCIAKFAHPDAGARALISGLGFYEREAQFYALLAPRSRVRTPRCYYSAFDASDGRTLLLLEDLAPARNGDFAAGCSVADAEIAVLGIAPFHAGWWADPLLARQAWLPMRGALANDQLSATLQYTWPGFLDKLGLPITPQLRDLGDWLARYIEPISAYLYEAPPATLVHNDYQGDNLFFPEGPERPPLVVADWQVTTRGRGPLDVASFLGGNLEPAERRRHEQRLLEQYHARLREHGVVDYSLAQCFDDYRIALFVPMARIAMAVGGMAAPGEPRGGPWDPTFARYWAAVNDLDARALVEALG